MMEAPTVAPPSAHAPPPSSLPASPPPLRPESGAVKWGERSAAHQCHHGEHEAAFTLKSERGRGSSELIGMCVCVCSVWCPCTSECTECNLLTTLWSVLKTEWRSFLFFKCANWIIRAAHNVNAATVTFAKECCTFPFLVLHNKQLMVKLTD